MGRWVWSLLKQSPNESQYIKQLFSKHAIQNKAVSTTFEKVYLFDFTDKNKG